MWRKILILLIGLVGTFSVIYAKNTNLLANESIYYAGGNVTGRVNQAPVGIQNTEIGMKKGDRVYMGTINPYTSAPLSWQLIRYHNNYTDYGCDLADTICTNEPINGWLSFSNDSVGYTSAGLSTSDFIFKYPTRPAKFGDYKNSNIFKTIKSLNNNLISEDKKIIAYRNLETIHYLYFDKFKDDSTRTAIEASMLNSDILIEVGQSIFTPNTYELVNEGILIDDADQKYVLAKKDLLFSTDYWGSAFVHNPNSSIPYTAFGFSGGARKYFINYAINSNNLNMRPAVYLNMDQVVFATSLGDETGYASIEIPQLSSSYTNIYQDAVGEAMKVRVENSELTNTTEFTDILNSSGDASVTISARNSIVKIKANAKAGSDPNGGINTVSVLVFDEDDNFVYYKPLASAKGDALYEFDTTGMDVGKYNIAIVNEVYNDANTAPAESSAITAVHPLEIVVGLSDLSFQATSDLEFGKNVNPGDTIGTISSQNGVGTPQYQLVANATKPDDVNHFEIDADGKTVVVKGNALEAGTYQFNIQATDGNGDPATPLELPVTVTVNKKTATVSFKTPTQTKIKIKDTGIVEYIDTNNTDLTTSSAQYSLSGGVAGTGLAIENDATDPKKFKINIGSTTDATLPAIFKLKVTLPETANFSTATSTEKDIYVYKELSSLTWTPAKAGSYNIDDVTSGKTVGTLLARDGVPDYTYAFTTSSDSGYDATKAEDNSMFTIASSELGPGEKNHVSTLMALTAGTYHIQFKVTDKNGDTRYADAIITVNANGQSPLKYKENGVDIGSKSIYYDDKDIMIQAEGGSTSSLPIYELSDPADQIYLTVTDQGNGTATLLPEKVTEAGKTVKVKATKAGNSSYSDISTELDVTIKQARQTLVFDDASSTKKVKKGSANYFETAKGTISSSGNDGVGGILYASDEPDVIEIDPDTGEITVGELGKAIITVTLNRNDPSNKAYDANYETKTITKTIEVYEGMSVSFTPISLQAEKTAIANAKAGSFTATQNNGNVAYQISNVIDPKNADHEGFIIIGNQLLLKQAITGKDISKHSGGNTYKIQVLASDDDGTITIDCEVTIHDAENDFYFTEDDLTTKINSISKPFGIGDSFNLYTKSSNGKPVTYQLKDGEDPDIISVDGTGNVTILAKGGPVKVEASVATGSGYTSKTIEIAITITAGPQSIAFDQPEVEAIQFIKNDTYASPAHLNEADGTDSKRWITYTSETTSVCTIDTSGTITMLDVGECKIKAENSDSDYIAVSTSKTITIYDGMGGRFTQNAQIPQAEESTASANTPIGSVSVNGGQGNKTYHPSSSATDNSEIDFFGINETSGLVSIRKNITAKDLASLPQDDEGLYIMKAAFIVRDALNNEVDIHAEIKVKGAKLDAQFDTGGKGIIEVAYAPNKIFTTDIINNRGKGIPVYALKTGEDIPNDVLSSIDANGVVTVENAVIGTSYAYVQASIPASGGYSEALIEVPVNITKASQPDYRFKKSVINLQTDSSLELETEGILSRQEDGSLMEWTMISDDQSVVKVSGHTITATKKEKNGVTVTASVKGDRNYKAAIATATVNVSSAPAYAFEIQITPATYGDSDQKKAEVFIDEGTGRNKKQRWTSSKPDVASIDPDTGEITILKAGDTTITCVQTSDGEPSVTASAVFSVDPKPITIRIGDASKKVGEAVPVFYASIDTDELIGSDSINQPVFTCKDEANQTVTAMTKPGTYTITGLYPSGANPNYDITIEQGTLSVTQDLSEETWYEMIGKDSGESIMADTWVSEAVFVKLKPSVSDPYNQISIDQTSWDSERVLIDQEGITDINVYFQKSDTKALSTGQQTTVRIDQTRPVIKSITGKNSQSGLRSLLHTLTFQKYFKPGMVVTIEAEDTLPEGMSDPAMSSGIQKIKYEITKLDGTGRPIGESNKMEQNDTSVEVSLKEQGTYEICATALDMVGNESPKKCEAIEVRKWGESSDDKDLPDINIDIDNDGTADINITRPGEKKPYLNIDTDGDGNPDINITRKGEAVIPGKTEPYLNIMDPRVKWNPTKEIDYDGDGEADFRTDGSLSAIISIDSNDDFIPDLNIDLDGDYVAELNIDVDNDHKTAETNIDSDGDQKADINIDIEGNGTPSSRIATNYAWRPDHMVKDEDGIILYGTTPDIQIDTIDSITDQGVIVKPKDPNQIFLPNYALKVEDITKKISDTVKTEIIEAANKEQGTLEAVYDIKMYIDDQVIQPDGSIQVSIPYTGASETITLMMKNKNNQWEEITYEVTGNYLMFTTAYLGEISIIKEADEPADPNPIEPEDPKDPKNPEDPSTSKEPSVSEPEEPENPKPSVQGNYTNIPNIHAIGGAETGDTAQTTLITGLGCLIISVLFLSIWLRKRHNKE